MTRRGVAVLAVLALVGLGCRTVREPPVPENPIGLPSPTVASRPADPAGQRACDAVVAVGNTQTAADPAAMVAAGEVGMTSANTAIASQSQMLHDVAEKTAAAVAAGNEIDIAEHRVALGQMVADLRFACGRHGYLA